MTKRYWTQEWDKAMERVRHLTVMCDDPEVDLQECYERAKWAHSTLGSAKDKAEDLTREFWLELENPGMTNKARS